MPRTRRLRPQEGESWTPQGRPRAVLAALAGLGLLGTAPVRADIGGEPSPVQALVGARIVTAPSSEPVRGTVILRDGRIEMVGTDVEIPDGAVRHELHGRTLYAGWVEPYLVVEIPEDPDGAPGLRHANPRVASHHDATDHLPLDPDRLVALRRAGYTVAQIAPGQGVLRGFTAVVTLNDGPPAATVLRARHAQALSVEWSHWKSQEYPASLMGAVALVRQTLYDSRWNHDLRQRWERDPENVDRPEENASLRALRPLLAGEMPWVAESRSAGMLPRVLELAREFSIAPIVVSTQSDHHRIVEGLAARLDETGATLVASVAFPAAPSWPDDDARHDVRLETLIDWERAPADLALLEAAGIDFAVTAHGLEGPKDMLDRLRTAVAHGLSPERALAAVTTRPAALLGVSHRVGTIEPGKDANLLVATGDLFAADSRVEAVWVEGVRHGPDPRPATPDDVTRQWELIDLAAPDSVLGTVGFARRDGHWLGRTREEASPGAARPTDVSLDRGVLSFERDGERWRLRRDGPFLRGDVRAPGAAPRPALARRSAADPPDRPGPLLSAAAPPWPPRYRAEDAPAAVLVR
ncbi:MAG TPA: amidohydrolase family protein, partial [bacterium]|nr:amidohydrolase family protein [bacterium]